MTEDNENLRKESKDANNDPTSKIKSIWRSYNNKQLKLAMKMTFPSQTCCVEPG